jgi:polysaccharide biosynthesis transport protein
VQKARLHELRLTAASPAWETSILVPAGVPGSPVSPRPARAAAIAGLVGLLAGFGLALAREHLVAHVRTAGEVEGALRSPVLAVVPRLGGRRARRDPLAVLDRPDSQVAEAYRIVRSNLAVAGVGEDQRVLLVTSALAGEGKSTVAVNLAIAFAESGVDTMLVDADLRRPRLHRMLGLPNERGLTTVLDQRLHPAEVAGVVDTAHLSGSLGCLTAGPSQAQPTSTLSGPAMEAALGSLRQSHLVIVDSPPVLPLADAGVLSTRADAIVVVVRPEMVSTGLLDELRARLAQAGATVVGVVVNAADPGTFEASGTYGYGYGYGEARGRHSVREDERSRFFRTTRNAG